MDKLIHLNMIEAQQNLIVMARGHEKTGKSRLGYTMPKPLFVACLDKPPDSNVKKWGNIDYKMYMPVRDPSRPIQDIIDENTAILDEFRTDLAEIMTYPSIMFDSASELWPLVRLAELGQETKVLARDYYAPNTIMRSLLSSLHAKSKNVLFTTRLKEKYAERVIKDKITSSPTGEYLPDTWKDLTFQVHVNVLNMRDNKEPYTYRMQVIDSAIDGALKGIELSDDDITWNMLLDLHYQ